MLKQTFINDKKIDEEVNASQTTRNKKNRQFTNKDARLKLKKLYPSIHD